MDVTAWSGLVNWWLLSSADQPVSENTDGASRSRS